MSEDAHARPSGDAPEPLYDLNVPTPTHAERARTLVAQISTGTLCTLALEPAGYPYGSFVTVALDDGAPIFLISRLAEHTKNLERDPRASLLVAEGGSADPLANGRVTMIGRCTRVKGEGGSARDAFLATHPTAAYYADFRDFAFWRLHVASVRYIGGYGRMSWVSEAEWQTAEPDPLGPSAAATIAHMNADHAYARLQGLFEGDRGQRREHDERGSVRVRDVGEDQRGAAARSFGVYRAGQHTGRGARRFDRDAQGRQEHTGLIGGRCERTLRDRTAVRSTSGASFRACQSRLGRDGGRGGHELLNGGRFGGRPGIRDRLVPEDLACRAGR